MIKYLLNDDKIKIGGLDLSQHGLHRETQSQKFKKLSSQQLRKS